MWEILFQRSLWGLYWSQYYLTGKLRLKKGYKNGWLISFTINNFLDVMPESDIAISPWDSFLQSLTRLGIINQSQLSFPSSLNGFLNTIPEGTTINSLNLASKTLSEREPTYFCPSRVAPATCVTFSWAFFLVARFGLTATETVINLLRLPINPAVLGTVDV